MDEMTALWLLPTVGGILLYAITSAAVRLPGATMAQKFKSLGTLSGKTRSEIEAVVGPPNAVSAVGNGKTLCQWMATGYHVALVFDGNTCEGISHESSV